MDRHFKVCIYIISFPKIKIKIEVSISCTISFTKKTHTYTTYKHVTQDLPSYRITNSRNLGVISMLTEVSVVPIQRKINLSINYRDLKTKE